MSEGASNFARWSVKDVLVAGRRVSGEAWGRTPAEAVRRFAAKKATEFKVNVAAAVSGATRDPYKKVEVIVRTKGSA